jgi:hypothetical protein
MLRELGVKFRFHSGWKPFQGYYDHSRRTIHIATYGLDARDFLSVVCHEAGHAAQAKYRLGMDYHVGYRPGYAHFRRWAMAALPAERAADIIGSRLMQRYFPGVKFKSGYDGAQGEKQVHDRVHLIGAAWFKGRLCPLCPLKVLK